MSTKFIYALALTICGAVFRLLLFFTGFETEKLAVGQHLNWLSLILFFIILWLGIKAVRDESPGGYMGYGRAVGTGTLITLLSGVMSAVYTFIHLKFVNPNFGDYQIALARTKWEAANMTEAQMEGAEKFMHGMLSPIAQTIATPIFVLIFGVICSLIIAAFVKRPAPPENQVIGATA